MRICSWCGQEVEEWCKHCIIEIRTRRDPNTMTADEREQELRAMEKCEVPFSLIHERIEALGGEPIFKHMMGNIDFLVKFVRRDLDDREMAKGFIEPFKNLGNKA